MGAQKETMDGLCRWTRDQDRKTVADFYKFWRSKGSSVGCSFVFAKAMLSLCVNAQIQKNFSLLTLGEPKRS